MATLQALKVSSGTEQMPGVGDGQSCKMVASTYSWTSAPASGDIIQSALIQAGSVITDVVVTHSGFGASGAFSVGYGGSTAYYAAAAAAVAAGVVRMSVGNIPYIPTANDTVDVVMTGTGASATGTVTIIVYFQSRNA